VDIGTFFFFFLILKKSKTDFDKKKIFGLKEQDRKIVKIKYGFFDLII